MTAHRESRAPRRRRLVAAAFHEAGHAVAAYHLHVRLRSISIGADEGDALGWLDLWLPHVTSGDAENIRQAQAVERRLARRQLGAQETRANIRSTISTDTRPSTDSPPFSHRADFPPHPASRA